MTLTPVAVVPLVSAALYLALIQLVRRRAPHAPSSRAFLVVLALLASQSLASFVWRISEPDPPSDYALRWVIAAGMSAGAAFVYLAQAQYPSRPAAQVRAFALIAGSVTALAALSDSVGAIAIEEVSAPLFFQPALFYAAVAAWILSYVVAAAYLSFVYRAERDPFERNRVKYLALATVLVGASAMTNMVSALQRLPLDQALYSLAALLFAFAIVRYRLFDINLAFKRGLMNVATALAVAPFFYAGLVIAFEPARAQLLSLYGLLATAGITVVVGGAAPIIRGTAERLFSRLLIGGQVRHDSAMMQSALIAASSRGVHEVARAITDRLQLALESGSVVLLLADESSEVLAPEAMSGPHARIQPGWVVRLDNDMLAQLVQRVAREPGRVVPPGQLRVLARSGQFSRSDTAEFGPYLDDMALMVIAHESLIGCLFIAPKIFDAAYSLEDLDLARAIASQIGIAIENARLIEQLEQRARTDFLTGLLNHRALLELLDGELSNQSRNRSLAAALVDIDNFKLLNDVHGHQAGDDALRAISAEMRRSLPSEAVLGRYGGDEFLIVFPGYTMEQARTAMSDVAQAVMGMHIRSSPALAPDADAGIGEDTAAGRLPVRISWGVAATPVDGVSVRSLISAADSRMVQRRFELRGTGRLRAGRPSVHELLEQDPETLRVTRALLELIDAKDAYTSEHSQQVASFCLVVAQELELSDRERYALWLGGLLHDVGKVGTPKDILRKPGRLSVDEWDAMRQHPALGEAIVCGLIASEEIAQIVGCHHERYDGSGYPRGLVGDEIPPLARIASVADAFSAMVHDRPYRKGLAWPDAARELRCGAGTQFDPELVEVFIRAMDLTVAGESRDSAGTVPVEG